MRSTLALAACLWVAGALAAEEKKEAPVRVNSLVLNKSLPRGKFGEYMMYAQTGTTLTLLLSQPDKMLLGINLKESKLARFTDDKDTDLTKTDARFPPPWLDPYSSQISTDGHLCLFKLQAPRVPARGAEKIQIKASLVLTHGKEEKSVEGKKITLKVDAETAVGPYTLKVTNTGGPFVGPQFSLMAPKRNVKGVEFLDAKGKPIKLMSSFASELPFPVQKARFHYTYALPAKAVPAGVKVSYFDKVESVTIPLDLSVGVGLD